jgi:hypothetical protein
MLDLAHMVALDHNMPSRPVNHNLLIRKTQQLPKLISQHLRLSIYLLHSRHGLVSASFPQSVNWQVVTRCPGDKVCEIRRAEFRR